MQRTHNDGERPERARERYRLDEVERAGLYAQNGAILQHRHTSDRSYGTTHVEGNATAVLGDIHGNLVNNHYHVQPQGPLLDKFNLLLESLCFDRMDARLRNIATALPNTCQWILQHEKFRTWVDPLRIQDHNGFLWVKGKPGCGKSTIMKIALDRTRRQDSMQTILSYFFNARAPGALEKSSIGLYRSLVHQILINASALCDYFTNTFAYKVRKGTGGEWTVDEWTANELKDFLVEVVQGPELSDMTVFIDALDEGDRDDIRQMIEFLEDLGDHATASHNRLRICLSSRHFPHITIRKGLILVMEDQTEHSQDIEAFVRTKLHGDQSAEMYDLQQEVCDKAAGIFLWVVLVVAMLNKTYDDGGSLDAIRKHLKSIPPELDALFADILTKTHEDFEECVTLLQFVLFSNKALSAADLYMAIHYSRDQSQPTELSVPDNNRLARRLLHYSRGLIEATTARSPIMQFIHESVRDFLVTPRGLALILSAKPENVMSLSHEKLKLACMRCILDFEKSSVKDSISRRWPSIRSASNAPNLPFLKYATSELFRHADSAQQGGICQADFLAIVATSSLLAKWIKLYNTFEKLTIRKHADVTLLYIATQQNLTHLLGCLLDEGANVDAVGGRFGTALQMACVNGSIEVVQLLLNRGADPNAIGGESEHVLATAVHFKYQEIIAVLQKYKLRVPQITLTKMFQESVNRGYSLGVRVSLDQGVDVNAPIFESGSALHVASKMGDEEMVHILVKAGATGDSPQELDESLRIAASCGYEKIVEILITMGADVSACGEHGTALEMACCGGYERLGVVQTLLKNIANIKARGGDFNYSYALYEASKEGHDRTVQLLVDGGADVNTCGRDSSSALQVACHFGHEKVVQILLGGGANTNSRGRDSDYGYAIEEASGKGYDRIVQWLVDAGADVNARSRHHGDALCVASRRGHDKVVQILLNSGADANAQVIYDGNALIVASSQGHKEVVQILLNHGADVNSQGGYHDSALCAAASYGHEEVVEILLNSGANVNFHPADDRHNALYQASYKGHDKVVQILLDRGATEAHEYIF